MIARLLFLAFLAAVAVGGWGLHAGRWQLPERWNPWNPWAPLHVADAPTPVTRYKLARLSGEPAMCLAALATADLRWQALPDRDTGNGCGFTNAVRIDRTHVQVGSAFSLSCRTAVSLALWETHVLLPAARSHFGQPVARIDHLGSYACRNVYGREDARRSQHATADALDIAGFTLQGGKRISVLRDWQQDPATTEALFLAEVHAGACRFFDGVLGPDYNAAHRDHFHLDRGSFRICR